MAKEFEIIFVEIEADEDSYTEGEVGYGWSYDLNHLVGNTYTTLKELISDIASYDPVFSDDPNDWVFIDGRLDTDAEINGDGLEPTKDEYQRWKDGDLKLYVAHMMVGVKVFESVHELTEEEAEAEGFSAY